MAEETEISTPVETVEDTSTSIEPGADTSTVEPEAGILTAETETGVGVNKGEDDPSIADTPLQETLYAGKYKSVEDLEKGYNEAQKLVAKASEFEKKYNELLQQKEAGTQRIVQEQLKNAQQRGFTSIEQAQIADAVQVAELEYYANNLNQITDPQNIEAARSYLAQYYQTGHEAFLNAAKQYFPSSFVENTAIEKSKYETQLQGQFEAQRRQNEDKASQQLADTLKADYAEFLADIKENEGKAKALKSFCDVGSINSKEDMQIFNDIYSQIANYERAQAIKEYEAQKAIEATKQAANIQVGSTIGDGLPTYEQIANMTQAQYAEAYEKFGDKLLTVN